MSIANLKRVKFKIFILFFEIEPRLNIYIYRVCMQLRINSISIYLNRQFYEEIYSVYILKNKK